MFKNIKKLYSIYLNVSDLYKGYSIIAIIIFFIFTQLLLLTSFFLPLKILMLLSSQHLHFQLFDLSRETIIMLLVLLEVVIFCIYLIFDNLIQKFKIVLCKYRDLFDEKNTLLNRYIDTFIRAYSTIFLIIILTFLVLVLYKLAGYFMLLYFVAGYFIIHKVKFSKKKYPKFFKAYSGIGFLLIFLVEIYDFLYFNYESITITTLLLILIIARYVFTRLQSILNQLVFLYSIYDKFILERKRKTE